MISHSVITAAWMLLALALYLLAGLSPFIMAFAITMWWGSREQYWEELKLREVGRDSWRDVVLTFGMILRPMERNMDLFAPTVVAWVLAAVFVFAGGF